MSKTRPTVDGLGRQESNFHDHTVHQALSLVTRVSDPSYVFLSSRTSRDLDGMDGMDDLDVATRRRELVEHRMLVDVLEPASETFRVPP